jgi:hypothetical protein
MVGVAGYINGSIFTGASVTNTAGAGVELGSTPPIAVGVGYCPHNDDEDVLPTQELNNMDIATNTAGSRFTMNRCWNYTCIDAADSR